MYYLYGINIFFFVFEYRVTQLAGEKLQAESVPRKYRYRYAAGTQFWAFFSESLVFGAPPVKFYDLAYYFV